MLFFKKVGVVNKMQNDLLMGSSGSKNHISSLELLHAFFDFYIFSFSSNRSIYIYIYTHIYIYTYIYIWPCLFCIGRKRDRPGQLLGNAICKEGSPEIRKKKKSYPGGTCPEKEVRKKNEAFFKERDQNFHDSNMGRTTWFHILNNLHTWLRRSDLKGSKRLEIQF